MYFDYASFPYNNFYNMPANNFGGPAASSLEIALEQNRELNKKVLEL